MSTDSTLEASAPASEIKVKEEPAESDVVSVVCARNARWTDLCYTAPEGDMADREGLDMHGEGFITVDMNTNREDDDSVVFARVAEVMVDASRARDFMTDALPPAAALEVEPELGERATAADKKVMAAGGRPRRRLQRLPRRR